MQVDISEEDVKREATREKVLEMYGASKIEAIPVTIQSEEVEQKRAPVPELPAEPSSGRLFMPPAKKRDRNEDAPVSLTQSMLYTLNAEIII